MIRKKEKEITVDEMVNSLHNLSKQTVPEKFAITKNKGDGKMKVYLIRANLNGDILKIFDALDKAQIYVECINSKEEHLEWFINYYVEEWDVE